MTVDVAGKVRRPGIAVLDAGSRVVDALEAAGGARRGVDLTGLNLARLLVDGEQILVGAGRAAGVAATVTGGTSPVAAWSTSTPRPGRPRVAARRRPVTAQAILAWRTEHGAFTASTSCSTSTASVRPRWPSSALRDAMTPTRPAAAAPRLAAWPVRCSARWRAGRGVWLLALVAVAPLLAAVPGPGGGGRPHALACSRVAVGSGWWPFRPRRFATARSRPPERRARDLEGTVTSDPRRGEGRFGDQVLVRVARRVGTSPCWSSATTPGSRSASVSGSASPAGWHRRRRATRRAVTPARATRGRLPRERPGGPPRPGAAIRARWPTGPPPAGAGAGPCRRRRRRDAAGTHRRLQDHRPDPPDGRPRAPT